MSNYFVKMKFKKVRLDLRIEYSYGNGWWVINDKLMETRGIFNPCYLTLGVF